MIEVLWIGRGGQGAFTAARLLGDAYALKDATSFALAFPSFGPERRGAPIRAFTKLSDSPINSRSEVKKSDYIICLDDSLFTGETLSGLKESGIAVLNTTKKYDDARVVTIDAGRIAAEILRLPIVNTVMLGALSALCSAVDASDIENAIDRVMPLKLREVNKAVVRTAADYVQRGAVK